MDSEPKDPERQAKIRSIRLVLRREWLTPAERLELEAALLRLIGHQEK
ncbi:hypothetical protein [Paraburkholderia sp. BL10I2N1]|nr:hypothetical protein [Paraburkholderia sp. BL10I2N1]TDN70448.1 hypothetical protein B0G77_3922 [Paraburkholderia sp. BL10I2N1]